MPAAIVARELNIRTVETVAVKSYDHQNQGGIKVLKEISQPVLDLAGKGGQGAHRRRPRSTPATRPRGPRKCSRRSFRHVYAKPKGRELVDTFITEVSQTPGSSSLGPRRRPMSPRSRAAGLRVRFIPG